MISPRFLMTRVLGVLCASAFVMCGPGSPSGEGPNENPTSYTIHVPDEDGNGNGADSLRLLDHDGSPSELSLVWTEDSRNVNLCPGTSTLNFSVVNNADHSPGRNLWFTILYYIGYEYVEGHSISPQNIDVPVGAEQPVEFEIGIRPEFASAGDRRIYIALIVQTDNPNLDDPDAFFQRLWLEIRPGQDCGVEEMPQPERANLNIQSVACQNHLVKFQVGERLFDTETHGAPTVWDYDTNYLSLERDGYLAPFGGRDHWWADLLVTNQIPNTTQATAAFGTHPGDTIFFHLAPRVECGGGGWVDFTGEGVVPPVAPPTEPPVDGPDEPPVDQPPVDEPPVDTPPVDDPPPVDPPVDEPPVDTPPVDDAPPVDDPDDDLLEPIDDDEEEDELPPFPKGD